MLITTQQYRTNSLSRTTAHPRIRATAQSPQPPRIAFSGFGKSPSLPCSIQRLSLSVTQQGRVSPITRNGLTLLPGLVRRPQHVPLGCQPQSPECSTHDSLSIYRNPGLFRNQQTSLPYSTAQWMRPAGQTHFSSNYPPPTTRTSSYIRSL